MLASNVTVRCSLNANQSRSVPRGSSDQRVLPSWMGVPGRSEAPSCDY